MIAASLTLNKLFAIFATANRVVNTATLNANCSLRGNSLFCTPFRFDKNVNG